MNITQALDFLYSISGVIVLLFYLPQLISVLKAQGSLEYVSLASWGVWSLCTFISFLYGLLVANDIKVAFFSLASSTFCAVIFSVSFFKKKRYQAVQNPNSNLVAFEEYRQLKSG